MIFTARGQNDIDQLAASTEEGTTEVGEDLSDRGGLRAHPGQPGESQQPSDIMFYVRRISIPYLIIAFSTLFPDVNMILSLLGGSVCGVCFIVLPVFFYRQAYIARPSKKDRRVALLFGWLIVIVTVPIGVVGVYLNLQKMMKNPNSGGDLETEGLETAET